jgi:GT2 family glycosyltransferase
MIDDDAAAPPHWLERHLAYFEDDTIGAVGGPADNYTLSNILFPRREPRQIGRIKWYGRTIGNMYDYPNHWRRRAAIEVDHVVGYNLAIRRVAFEMFEERLRPYWQKFETELCLQVSRRGYRILFDFGNVVNHYPTNTAYTPGRSGDLEVKVYNAAFNWAFVLSKHSPGYLKVPRLLYLLLIGSSSTPGMVSVLTNTLRGGSFLKEAALLPTTLRNFVSGWSAGIKARA